MPWGDWCQTMIRMKKVIRRLEIPLDDSRDVAMAARYADRIEVCRSLDREGLSPSPELVAMVRLAVEESFRSDLGNERIPPALVVLHQERPPLPGVVGADHSIFVPESNEVESLLADVPRFADAGASSVVIGFLGSDGLQDDFSIERVVGAAESVGMSVAFHRAFDLLPDPADAVVRLRDLGVRRSLASGVPGFDPNVIDFERRRDRLETALQAGGDDFEIVLCGGVRAAHLERMRLPFQAVHASCRSDPDASGRRVFDPDVAAALRTSLDLGGAPRGFHEA